MPIRTYIPALLFIAERFCRYIRRYRPQIEANLSSEGKVALGVALTACEALEAFLIISPPTE